MVIHDFAILTDFGFWIFFFPHTATITIIVVSFSNQENQNPSIYIILQTTNRIESIRLKVSGLASRGVYSRFHTSLKQMKLSSTTLLLIICVTTIFLLASFYNTAMHGMASESHIASATDVERMIRVIRIQNETIHALAGHASEGSSGHNDVNSLLKIIQEKEMQLSLLSDELQKSKQATQEALSQKVEAAPVGDFPISHTYSKDISSPSSSSYSLDVPPAKLQAECEAYYGMQLVDNWRAKKELWCGTDEGASMQSSLHCYPYTQHHKNSPDMFCEATNFVIDFSKVRNAICPQLYPY